MGAAVALRLDQPFVAMVAHRTRRAASADRVTAVDDASAPTATYSGDGLPNTPLEIRSQVNAKGVEGVAYVAGRRCSGAGSSTEREQVSTEL
jgi:hypothetical protein